MPELIGDTALLIKLRARHAWSELVRWFYITGSDLEGETSFADRIFQLYAAVLISAAFVLVWLSFLDAAAQAGATLSAAACAQAASLSWAIPAAAFVSLLVHYLRSCPIRMTHPDILWLSSNLLPASWVLSGLVFALLPALAVGALGGFAVGTALRSVVEPAVASASLAVAMAASVALSWLLGAARHLRVVRFGSGRQVGMDMRSVVQANALYAELQPLRAWAAQSPSAYEEARRRKLMASRRPLFNLPDLQGRRLLVARGALSLVRQREGLSDLVVWGAGIVPMGALLLSAPSVDVGILLAWAMAAVSLAPRAREVTRVFSDDGRVKTIESVMVCSRFEQLVLDSFPAASLVALLSLAVVFSAAATGFVTTSLPAAILICLSLTAVLAFAGGIDPAAPDPAPNGSSFEAMIAGYLVLVGVLSFSNPAALAVGGCAYAVWLGVKCRRSLAGRS